MQPNEDSSLVAHLISFRPADVLFHDNSIKQLVAAAPKNSPKKVTNDYSQMLNWITVSFRLLAQGRFFQV